MILVKGLVPRCFDFFFSFHCFFFFLFFFFFFFLPHSSHLALLLFLFVSIKICTLFPLKVNIVSLRVQGVVYFTYPVRTVTPGE